MKQQEKTGVGNRIPKEGNPFSVPDHYFDNFASRLSDRIHEKELTEKNPALSEKPALHPRLVSAIAGPVALAVVLVTWFVFIRHPSLKIPQAKFSEAIEYTGYYYEEDMLLQTLETPSDSVSPGLDKKDIIDYLGKEDIDIDQIADVL